MKIGLIDDRKDVRETTRDAIYIALRKLNIHEVKVFDIAPPKEKESILAWISEENISVLILDELLTEDSDVDYQGHNIGEYIKTFLPDYPMYIVTSNKGEELVNQYLTDYFAIYSREEFEKSTTEFVNNLIKSGSRFTQDHGERLIAMNQISEKIALGTVTKKEIDQLTIIRSALNLNSSFIAIPEHVEEFKDLADKIDQLQKLSDKIENKLKYK